MFTPSTTVRLIKRQYKGHMLDWQRYTLRFRAWARYLRRCAVNAVWQWLTGTFKGRASINCMCDIVPGIWFYLFYRIPTLFSLEVNTEFMVNESEITYASIVCYWHFLKEMFWEGHSRHGCHWPAQNVLPSVHQKTALGQCFPHSRAALHQDEVMATRLWGQEQSLSEGLCPSAYHISLCKRKNSNYCLCHCISWKVKCFRDFA